MFVFVDAQFATVEVILLTLQRFFKQLCNLQGRFVPDLVVIGLCSVCFIGGIPYITQVSNRGQSFSLCHFCSFIDFMLI